jgi:signal transduction histidine kinase
LEIDPAMKRKQQVSAERTADSVIVHDMKNLAFRLSALLQNMDENYENPLFKNSMMDVLGDTIRKMETIVKRFRENQQQVIVKLRIDVNQMLKELAPAIIAKTNRNIVPDIELSDVPLIWADPYYLHNAFSSIIENSIDAMPNGGSLKVETKLLTRRKKTKVVVEISDTGVGMTKSFMENTLFRPFMSTKDKGLGLGLFTCQQIVQLHQGSIEVESAPNSGTIFRIILPAEVHV